jgi:hypothetical protein
VLADRTETKRIAWIRLAKRFANALFAGFCAASKAWVLAASPTPNYMTVRILARPFALLTALFGVLDMRGRAPKSLGSGEPTSSRGLSRIIQSVDGAKAEVDLGGALH